MQIGPPSTRRAAHAAVGLTLCLLLVSCGAGRSSAITAYPIPVVTTISTLNSFVRGVGGNLVRVQSLVPIGASPETYQPTPQSVEMLGGARLLVENGAGLETWLGGLLQNAGNGHVRVVVGSQGLPVIGHNPHLWMDPQYAKHYVARIALALQSLDPAHRAQYARNAAAYERRLDALTAWIRAQVDTVPHSRRVLIVFHNAWQYYDDRFGITTLGIIETAPGQEPNPHDFGHTVDLARAHHVHAIFSEPEYSPKLAQALAHDAGIRIVENLYDDSIGTTPEVSNYIAMLRYDTAEIVRSMR
ncbi:MAG: metal ABC transporter substrate-binding protein [Candidatus Tyrphobacter sp.]